MMMLVLAASGLSAACSGSGGSPRVTYGVGVGMGYGGYYGRAPYGYYRPRPPVVIGGPGPDIDRPVATPLPAGPDLDFGMPDAGFNDFGDFDF